MGDGWRTHDVQLPKQNVVGSSETKEVCLSQTLLGATRSKADE